MQELIKIERRVIGASETNAVSARDLHVELGIDKDFTDWIKAQIDRAGLRKEVDYIVTNVKVERDVGSSFRKEYIITADASKHIAMMSQGAKAKEVRDYFIAVEKEHTANVNAGGDFSPVMELLKKMMEAIVANSNAILELATAIRENIEWTKRTGFETAMSVYSIDESLNRKNIDDTLSTDMLDTIKLEVSEKAKYLSLRHDIALDDVRRLIYSKLNSNFEISTYYKIPYMDFDKAIFFIQNLKLNKNSLVAEYQPTIQL